MDDIARRVVILVAAQAGVDAQSIRAEMHWQELGMEGADSLDWVELVMEFKNEFGISWPTNLDRGEPRTVGDLIE